MTSTSVNINGVIIGCSLIGNFSNVTVEGNISYSFIYDAAAAAGLFVSGQASGELVIGYTGDTPTCDIPATIILLN